MFSKKKKEKKGNDKGEKQSKTSKTGGKAKKRQTNGIFGREKLFFFLKIVFLKCDTNAKR